MNENENFFKIIITNKKDNKDVAYNYLFGLRNEEKDVKSLKQAEEEKMLKKTAIK